MCFPGVIFGIIEAFHNKKSFEFMSKNYCLWKFYNRVGMEKIIIDKYEFNCNNQHVRTS